MTLFVIVLSPPTFLSPSTLKSFIEECEVRLLMTLQKEEGGLHHILCGEYDLSSLFHQCHSYLDTNPE